VRGIDAAASEYRRLDAIYQRCYERLREAFQFFEEGLRLEPRHPELNHCLAEAYEGGYGITRSLDHAVEAHRRAAECGHSRSQKSLDQLLFKQRRLREIERSRNDAGSTR